MTSGGREFLKWLAVLLMTGDHVAKVSFGGYLPVVSELGRVAFPLFALVMAYNLAQPAADLAKSVRRLALWAVIAQPAHCLVFGYWLPLNVLASFALAASVVWAIRAGRWWAVVALAGPLPLIVDYQWSGIAIVVAAYGWFRAHGKRMHWLLGCGEFRRSRLYLVLPIWVWISMALLCLYNGNLWALLALPLMQLGEVSWRVPRTRWAFYGYYVGHLAVLASCGAFRGMDDVVAVAGLALSAVLVFYIVKGLRTFLWVRRSMRAHDQRPPAPQGDHVGQIDDIPRTIPPADVRIDDGGRTLDRRT